MGGDWKTPDAPDNPYARAASGISLNEYFRTAPQRETFSTDYNRLRDPNFDVSELPQAREIEDIYNTGYNAARPQIENQYGQAKENIYANLPQGGALAKTLAENEMNRAGAVSNLGMQTEQQKALARKQIVEDTINRMYGIATGAPGQALTAMGGLANAQTQQGIAQMQGRFNGLDAFQQLQGVINPKSGKSK